MQPQIRRKHHRPFGAQLTAAGEVRFRLWAPAAREVDVMLYDSGGRQPSGGPQPRGGTQPLAMRSLPGGWFELETAAARPGSRYRYRLDGVREVADPASRCNPEGVHGPSEVIDPCAFAWDDALWRAPPWPEAVIYELHVGAFSPEGTFAGVAARLEHLARLGVTALQLIPGAVLLRRLASGCDSRRPRRERPAHRQPDRPRGACGRGPHPPDLPHAREPRQRRALSRCRGRCCDLRRAMERRRAPLPARAAERRVGRLLRRLRAPAARPAVPRPGAGLRLPGRALGLPGPAAWREQGAPAAQRLRQLPAEPRPDRQPSPRRAPQRSAAR